LAAGRTRAPLIRAAPPGIPFHESGQAVAVKTAENRTLDDDVQRWIGAGRDLGRNESARRKRGWTPINCALTALQAASKSSPGRPRTFHQSEALRAR